MDEQRADGQSMDAYFIGGPRAGEIHPIKSATPRMIIHHDGAYTEYLLVRWIEVGGKVAEDSPLYYVWSELDEATADAAILAHRQALSST